MEPVYASYERVPDTRDVTCWVSHCSAPAHCLVKLSRPIFGTPLIALCDSHVYDFETSTVPLP